jgi:hypothetical protein
LPWAIADTLTVASIVNRPTETSFPTTFICAVSLTAERLYEVLAG